MSRSIMHTSLLACAILFILLFAGNTAAALIAVTNPGFEDDPLNAPALTDGQECNFNCADFPGWGITQNSWIMNPSTSQAVLPAGYGDQVLETYFNAGGLQNVDAFYTAGGYRLTVNIGDRLDTGFAPGHIALYAMDPSTSPGAATGGRGGTGVVIGLLNFDDTLVTTNGGWTSLTLDVSDADYLGATCGVVGQNCEGWRIQIGLFTLGSSGTRVLFDNVVLEAVPLPSAVWLFGSGLLGLIGISRRK